MTANVSEVVSKLAREIGKDRLNRRLLDDYDVTE